jgi:hypothetical protein
LYNLTDLAAWSPLKFAVEAGKGLTYAVPVSPTAGYNLTLHGPNGFVRHLWAPASQYSDGVTASLSYSPAASKVTVVLGNAKGLQGATATVTDNAYHTAGSPWTVPVAGGAPTTLDIDVSGSGAWYDLTVTFNGETPLIITATRAFCYPVLLLLQWRRAGAAALWGAWRRAKPPRLTPQLLARPRCTLSHTQPRTRACPRSCAPCR